MASKKKAPMRAKPKSDDITAEVLAGIRGEIGEDGAFVLGSDDMALKIRGVISTQCPSLDVAIGRGGIPLARLTLLHGGEGSGKTTLALHTAAETQQQGGLVVYIDKEYKLDPDYAQVLGVDTKRLIISQPRTLEQVIKVIKGSIKRASDFRVRTGKRKPILVVVDSINACLAKARLEGEVEDHHIAAEARLWSQNLPDIIEDVAKEDVSLLMVSQVRSKIGVMFGSNEDMAGGNAPRFYASLIMYVKRIGSIKDKDGAKVGSRVEVECRKNQIAPPFKKADMEIVYGKGVDFERSLLRQAEAMGLVEKSGSWYSHEHERIGQGIAGAAEVLRGNKEWRDRIMAEVRETMGWDT